ncbi:MAG TPA: four helix bundle protein [Verrucomicrobiae bacterium]|nr:four helix bundle protein [Verrucomicrobiae bacterium]
MPKETVAQVPGNQALRSGTSVGANHREAGRARSKAEFISKIGDSLKEADETAYCIGRSCWQMKKLCQENGWSRYRRKPMS